MLWEALWATGWLVELSGNASKVQRRTKEVLCSYVTIQYISGLYTLAARIMEHKRTQPLLNSCPSLWRTGFLMEGALDWVFAIYLFASFSKIILSLVISIFPSVEWRYYVISLWCDLITTTEIQVYTKIYLYCLQMIYRSFQIFS